MIDGQGVEKVTSGSCVPFIRKKALLYRFLTSCSLNLTQLETITCLPLRLHPRSRVALERWAVPV